MRVTRRRILLGAVSLAGLAVAGRFAMRSQTAAADTTYAVTHTDAEWQKLLKPDQYAVLRQAATEPAGSSPLLNEHRKGVFACAGCDLSLFSSDTKFESGTGWPSFWKPLDGAVKTQVDNSFFMQRIEVHCARCGGHLGHLFDDGPQPTGLRYCMNGLALVFHPTQA
jgi:peptide-methionine (R)-S-oxide reductase